MSNIFLKFFQDFLIFFKNRSNPDKKQTPGTHAEDIRNRARGIFETSSGKLAGNEYPRLHVMAVHL